MPEPSIQSAPSASPLPPAPGAPPTGSTRSPLFIVFLVVFVDLLGFGIVLPLLPLFGKMYVAPLLGIPPAPETTGVPDAPPPPEHWQVGAVVGLLMASFSTMQFLLAPGWGRLSDRIGRRPVLLLGLFGSVLFYSLFGFALSLPAAQAGLALALLFVSRIGAGAAGATIGTAQAAIADVTTPEKRKVGMALIGAAFGIGFTFGPLLGAGLLYFFPNDNWLIGVAAAALSLTALTLGLVLLPETRTERSQPSRRRLINFDAVRLVLRTPALAPVVLTFFLATLGFGGFEVTLSYLNADALHLPKDENFLLFAYVGFTLMLAQGVLYRRLAKRVTEPTFMAAGMVLMGVGVGTLGAVNYLGILNLMPFYPLLGLMLFSVTVAVTGFALLTPSAQALVSRRSDPARQGEILGVNQSASALARILGPVVGLTLYKATPTHLLPYAFGAALLLIMLPLIPRIRRGEGDAVEQGAVPAGLDLGRFGDRPARLEATGAEEIRPAADRLERNELPRE